MAGLGMPSIWRRRSGKALDGMFSQGQLRSSSPRALRCGFVGWRRVQNARTIDRSLGFFLVLWLGLVAASQGEASTTKTLRFGRITLEDGLSHRRVYDILQDQQGFLWFATQNGLDRFDGLTIKSFRREAGDPSSLPDSYVVDLAEDERGTLWIATKSGGLARYDRFTESFSHYRHDPDDPRSLSSDQVSGVVTDSNDQLWVATQQGLGTLDSESRAFTRFLLPESGAVNSLMELPSGRLGVSSDSGFFVLDTHRREVERIPSLDQLPGVQSAVVDRQDRLWIGTVDGLWQLEGSGRAGDVYRFGSRGASPWFQGNVYEVLQDSESRIWVTTIGSGLLRVDKKNDSVAKFAYDPNDPSSLASDLVFCITEDRTGILWIGTDSGVSFLAPSRQVFDVFASENGGFEGTSLRNTVAIHPDRGGDLWLGSAGLGLTQIDREGNLNRYQHRSDDPGSVSHDWVWAILEDSTGDLWIGTEVGLDRLDRVSRSFRRYRHDDKVPNSVVSGRVIALLEDRSGDLWIGTAAGLDRYDSATDAFLHRSSKPILGEGVTEAASVLELLQDRSGDLWIGKDGSGLERLDPTTLKSTIYLHDPENPESLVGNVVTALHEDSAGELWVGTLDGLDRFDAIRSSFVHIRPPGFPPVSITSIESDENGNFWLGTSRQLIRFRPSTEEFSLYDASDGLLADGYGTKASARGLGGELFFGGPEGYVSFFPDQVGVHREPPPVALTTVKVGDRLVSAGVVASQSVLLTHRDRALTAEFAALDFANPRKNRYAYRLKGFEDKWTETDAGSRSAHYTNLDPGRYVLEIKASNRDGIWNEDGASMQIMVLPPPWKT